MMRLAGLFILGNVLPKLALTARRGVSAVEEVTQGKYLLKVDLAPFKQSDVTVKSVHSEITLSGRREKKTGVSDWSHEVHMVFTLPTTIKPDTLQISFTDDNILLVSGETKS